MENSKMKLSIIVPVYNAEKYIENCLESVLEQIDDKTEILIVNDGSTDASLDICKRYAEEYACIKIVDKENGGVSTARNAALERATGEWLTFVDADDMFQKTHFLR